MWLLFVRDLEQSSCEEKAMSIEEVLVIRRWVDEITSKKGSWNKGHNDRVMILQQANRDGRECSNLDSPIYTSAFILRNNV